MLVYFYFLDNFHESSIVSFLSENNIQVDKIHVACVADYIETLLSSLFIQHVATLDNVIINPSRRYFIFKFLNLFSRLEKVTSQSLNVLRSWDRINVKVTDFLNSEMVKYVHESIKIPTLFENFIVRFIFLVKDN